MITHKNLYDSICSFENLMLAAQKAQRGKRFEPAVLAFNNQLEKNIFQIQRELLDGSYQPGNYHGFFIYEPKKRMISAAPYRDRVIHHAVCNIIEPIFDKTFIYDSYACRKEKGTHKAVLRFTEFCRKNKYVLKCDIRKYFPSIDHEILKSLIRRKIACKRTLWLIDKIIDNSNPQEEAMEYFPGDDLFAPVERRKGIPIGNLTSQFFANIYLNGLDHYIKEVLRCAHCIRYCDDFVLFNDDKAVLKMWRKCIIGHLNGLRLKLHENKSQARQVKDGALFLGFRIYPQCRRLKRDNVVALKRRLKRFRKLLGEGRITLHECRQSLQAWLGHAQWANTRVLRDRLAGEWGLA